MIIGFMQYQHSSVQLVPKMDRNAKLKVILVGELFSKQAISVAFCIVLKKSEGSPPKVKRNGIFTLKLLLW